MTDVEQEAPRVGLVLGAGGILGGAWLVGALDAIAAETGWDPGSADRIVGTSAGSMIGALVASGVPPWFMVAHSAGDDLEGLLDAGGAEPTAADRSAGGVFRLGARTVARPRLVEARARLDRAALPALAGLVRLRLAAARLHLDRAAEGHRAPRARRGRDVGAASRVPRRRLRLRHARAGRLRRARRARGAHGRRGRRLVRDPRLLPPGRDRRVAGTSTAACARRRTSTS